MEGLDCYYQIMDDICQKISLGKRLSRIEKMEYYGARREICLSVVDNAWKNGNHRLYKKFNSEAEICNRVLTILEFGKREDKKKVHQELELQLIL